MMEELGALISAVAALLKVLPKKNSYEAQLTPIPLLLAQAETARAELLERVRQAERRVEELEDRKADLARYELVKTPMGHWVRRLS